MIIKLIGGFIIIVSLVIVVIRKVKLDEFVVNDSLDEKTDNIELDEQISEESSEYVLDKLYSRSLFDIHFMHNNSAISFCHNTPPLLIMNFLLADLQVDKRYC